MKRFIITEEEKSRILNLHSLASKKFVVSEAYEGGLVMQGDKICDIVCKNKYAGVGAKGDIVKMIQHLLSNNGFGGDFYGGGMKQGCDTEFPSCDGDYRTRTKDAVASFQQEYRLSPDGVVGYQTHKAMCDNLKFTNSLPKATFCPTCKCENNQNQNEIPTDQEGNNEIINQIPNLDCEKIKKCLIDNINNPSQIFTCLLGSDISTIPGPGDIPTIPGPGDIPTIPGIPNMSGCQVCQYLMDKNTGYIDIQPTTNIDPLRQYKVKYSKYCAENCKIGTTQ